MARRTPVDVAARRHALRELMLSRKHRGEQDALDLLTSTGTELARLAATLLEAGNIPEARRYARAYQLITESRARLSARRLHDREAQLEREAAEHGITAGESVRVTRASAGTTVEVGEVVVVSRVHGPVLFTGEGRHARVVWAADAERLAPEPDPETVTCPRCARDHVPDEGDPYDDGMCVECLDNPGGEDQ